MKYHFANPEFFYLFILIPIFIIIYILKRKKLKPTFTIPTFEGFERTKPSIKQRLRYLWFVLRLLAFSAFIIALARPQTTSQKETVSTEGIDIILAIDVSTSMLAEDLKPNRIEAAKKTAIDFIKKRENDRIGLVIFSGESFTQCPITIDHQILINLLENVKSGMIEDGTAIGNGLATSVSRLKDIKSKSKVVILLTDGVNNMGAIAPITAAEIAKSFDIKVYTIGIGTKGMAPYPIKTPYGIQYRNVEVEIDEPLMQNISKMTDGVYYRATNNKSLENIYNSIDQLEKTKTEVATFKKNKDEFYPIALLGFAILIFEILLRYIFLRTLP
ncbi:MAG TPA: VWA domain-containing protein [Candidatus Kapabacteria bacterium]|nr:VWA domain-containing protein [Candidatus Kapabacteria bacterium]